MSPVPVVLAWSGGKDSALALAALRASPDYEVVALLTTITTEYDRISIHGVRRSILAAQAAALGVPLFEAAIPATSSNADYEGAFAAALGRVRAAYPGVGHAAFGDLFLADVRAYREALLARCGWAGTYPLWGRDTTALAREFVAANFKATICCVDTSQLAASFAGRSFDSEFLSDLPGTVDPCGERGEFHSCVHDGPIFSHGISVRVGEQLLRENRFQYCDLLLKGEPPG